MRRKIFSILLSVAMVMVMMPSMAFAEGGTEPSSSKTSAEFLALADENKTITLSENNTITEDITLDGAEASYAINLNGKTLTVGAVTVKNGATLTVENGYLKSTVTKNTKGVICVETGSSVKIETVNFDTQGAALFPCGNAAKVEVNDSEITATAYAVATNASSDDNHNVQIKLKNSSFSGWSPVLVNIPCKLDIDNCDIIGGMQGVVVRGGTADIKNSTITLTYGDSDADDMAHYFDSKNWGQGNMVNLAAMTIGNKVDGAYNYPTNVTLSNTKLLLDGAYGNKFPALYSWANTGEGKGVYLAYDDKCTFGGEKVYGDNGRNTVVNEYVNEAKIGNTYYATLQDAIAKVADGDEVILLKDWQYEKNGTGLLNITKSIVLNGNGKKISGYGSRGGNKTTLAINNGGSEKVDVTLKNLTIENPADKGRPVETRGNIGSLKIDNCNLIASGSGNNQVLTIGGNQEESATVSVKDSEFSAGNAGYPMVIFNPVNMNIENSEFTGYCSLYFNGVNSSAGSRNSVVNAVNSKFDAPNIYDGSDNSFGAFVFEDDGITLALDSCKINTKEGGSAIQGVVLASSWAKADRQLLPCTITIKGNSQVNGRLMINNWDTDNCHLVIQGGTFSTDPTSYIASGYVVSGSGPYTVYKYVAPPTEKDPVSNEGTAGTDDAITNADLTDKVITSDGKTEAVVDQDIADKIVEAAKENKSTEVIVEATTTAGKSDASQVALPETTVKAIAEKTDAAITIKTDNAEVTLDKEAVNAVADHAGTTGTVKLVVETVENTDEKVVVELKLETSNGYVSDFKGGNVSVTVPVAKDMADKKVVCVYIDDNGIYHKVDGAMNEAGTHYTFTTGHFSTYAIMSEEEADAVIKDQTAAAQKAAIKKVKTTVTLSTKDVKKGIRVTVKVPVDQKADKTGIILYRSMKKDSGYAMYKKVETKSSTYIITNTKNVKGNRLTAGKKYYYKARAYKVVDGKTYYGPMSTVKYMKAK